VKSKILVVLVVLSFLLGIVAFSLKISEVKSAGEGWLSGYGYRKSHLVLNYTGAGTNYQVMITVVNGTGSDSAGTVYINKSSQANFNDIRFADVNGTTQLDYWMEESGNYCNPGANATFWVEIPGDLGTTNQTIYMYYGNSTVTSGSNGDNTFLFFDDFNDGSINTTKWGIYKSGTNNPVEVNGELQANGTSDTRGGLWGKSNWTTSILCRMRVWINVSSTNTHAGIHNYNGTADTGYCNLYRYSSGNLKHYANNGTGGSSDTGVAAGTTNILDVSREIPPSGANHSKLLLNNTLKTVRTTYIPLTALPIGFGAEGATDGIRVDWCFMRKTIESEPSHSTWGAEETAPNAAPSNGSPSTTSWDDTDNCYSQKKYYEVNVTFTDTDGYADFQYVLLTLKQSTTMRAQFKYNEDTNTASCESGSATWDFNTTASLFTETGNTIVSRWQFMPQWDATEESGIEIELYCIDTAGLSDNDTLSNNFDVITTLTTSGLSADDSRINIGGTSTISGTVYYANDPASTTSSSSYPPDAEFTSVSIHDASHSVLFADSTIVNGVVDGSGSIPNVVQSNTYHVYINMADVDYTDGDTSDGDTVAVIGDGFSVFNLQSVRYLGQGNYGYDVQIKYAYDDVLISGAYVALLSPNGTLVSEVASNSSGWASFNLIQADCFNRTFTLYGINETSYGLIAKVTNQTFAINKWNLNVVDTQSNFMTSNLELNVSANSVAVWNGSASTIYVPSNSYNVSVVWLNILTVNTTVNANINADATTNLSALCYPFTISATIYHAGSNATITATTFASNLLSLSFNSPIGTYVLLATGPKPTYVLNVTYNLATAYATYLQLAHYGNASIQISYASWGTTYIQSSDQLMTGAAWEAQRLRMTFSGSGIGTLVVYCGSRGNIVDSEGFVTTVYTSDTRLTGSYAINNGTAALSLNWEEQGGGFTTGKQATADLAIFVELLFSQNATSNSSIAGVLHVTWRGDPITFRTIYLYDLRPEKSFADWKVDFGRAPGILTRDVGVDFGEGFVNVTLWVPDVVPSVFRIAFLANFTAKDGGPRAIGTVLSLTILGSESFAVSDYMPVVLLTILGAVILTSALRNRGRHN
jgi:hypothetical protein